MFIHFEMNNLDCYYGVNSSYQGKQPPTKLVAMACSNQSTQQRTCWLVNPNLTHLHNFKLKNALRVTKLFSNKLSVHRLCKDNKCSCYLILTRSWFRIYLRGNSFTKARVNKTFTQFTLTLTFQAQNQIQLQTICHMLTLASRLFLSCGMIIRDILILLFLNKFFINNLG